MFLVPCLCLVVLKSKVVVAIKYTRLSAGCEVCCGYDYSSMLLHKELPAKQSGYARNDFPDHFASSLG
jgi:hypothetical protein